MAAGVSDIHGPNNINVPLPSLIQLPPLPRPLRPEKKPLQAGNEVPFPRDQPGSRTIILGPFHYGEGRVLSS